MNEVIELSKKESSTEDVHIIISAGYDGNSEILLNNIELFITERQFEAIKNILGI